MKSRVVVCATLLCSGAVAQEHKPSNPVPDSETAIKIAEAALIPVYGKAQGHIGKTLYLDLSRRCVDRLGDAALQRRESNV
jgi:hypothetical protein